MTIRLALCDDTEAFRYLLRLLFEAEPDFEVVGVAEDGVQVVEMVAATQPDVLLLDVAMPRRDGIGALPHVFRASPTTTVVMFTGFMSDDVERRAKAAGAARVLVKGLRPDELIDAVRSAAPRATRTAEEVGDDRRD